MFWHRIKFLFRFFSPTWRFYFKNLSLCIVALKGVIDFAVPLVEVCRSFRKRSSNTDPGSMKCEKISLKQKHAASVSYLLLEISLPKKMSGIREVIITVLQLYNNWLTHHFIIDHKSGELVSSVSRAGALNSQAKSPKHRFLVWFPTCDSLLHVFAVFSSPYLFSPFCCQINTSWKKNKGC